MRVHGALLAATPLSLSLPRPVVPPFGISIPPKTPLGRTVEEGGALSPPVPQPFHRALQGTFGALIVGSYKLSLQS